jgi:hypothetical protein
MGVAVRAEPHTMTTHGESTGRDTNPLFNRQILSNRKLRDGLIDAVGPEPVLIRLIIAIAKLRYHQGFFNLSRWQSILAKMSLGRDF